MEGNDSCSECGAKAGRGGVILQHRRGCSHKVVKPSAPVIDVVEPVVVVPEPRTLCQHCGTAMRRLNCGGMTHRPEYSVCRHNRGLESECEDCRKIQHGKLVWGCPKCKQEFHEGRQMASMNYEIRGEVDFGH